MVDEVSSVDSADSQRRAYSRATMTARGQDACKQQTWREHIEERATTRRERRLGLGPHRRTQHAPRMTIWMRRWLPPLLRSWVGDDT